MSDIDWKSYAETLEEEFRYQTKRILTHLNTDQADHVACQSLHSIREKHVVPDLEPTPETASIYQEIQQERIRQDAKWGEQNHDDFIWTSILGEEFGEASQAALHDRFGGGRAGTLRFELIHVTAVAVQWIECLDRRTAAEGRAS